MEVVADAKTEGPELEQPRLKLVETLRFLVVHVAALVGAILTGVTWKLLVLCLATYVVRMFFVTGGYHRYFAHRSYRTSRAFQFFLALMGTTAIQRGPLWWAGRHREHHRYSDTPKDIHSPTQRGFWWAHIGWMFSGAYDSTPEERIKDFAKYPEIRFLNRHWLFFPLLLLALLWVVGGPGAAVWGGLVSTVILWHGTFTINSLAHVFGRRRYQTTDTSRNSFILALITMGEGWHNNHHHYGASAAQGFFWWELDVTYRVLWVLEKLRIIADLKVPPLAVKENRVPALVAAGAIMGEAD